jgi:Uma2 family endonuclease
LVHSEVLIHLPTRPSGRQPDIAIVLNEHHDQLKPTYIEGPADIVIEVISPESQERDRIEKLREYAQAGIPEYWLIDPGLRTAEFFILQDGEYEAAPLDADGRFHSTVLAGFWLSESWLWQQPTLPEIAAAWTKRQEHT